MEQTRKYLKLSSIVVLIFAGVHLINAVAQFLWGELNNATVPEGSPENIVLITQIVLLAVSLLLLLPEVYIGVKGLLISKNPSFSKGHIVWAIILLVLAGLGLIHPIVNIVNQGFTRDTVSTFLFYFVDIIVYGDYIKYARAVLKEC